MGSLCWSRLLTGAVTHNGLYSMGRTHATAVHEELQAVGRTHVEEVHEGLYSMGGTPHWSRERA